MSSILLGIHVLLAIMTLGISVAVVWAPLKAEKRVIHMWQAFCGVVLTGVGLVMVNPAGLGRVCLLTSIYLVILGAAHGYQRYVTVRA